MCLGGVVASWSLTQEVAGSRPFNIVTVTDPNEDSLAFPDLRMHSHFSTFSSLSGNPDTDNFEQTRKARENHTKYWKIQGISDKYGLLFLMIFN